MKENVSEIESSLSVLYESFVIMNRVCWQGRLPPCLLRMSYRLSLRIGAYASSQYRIVFNAKYSQCVDDSVFLQIMAHEMIHIWQYSLGRRGGHGRDFKNEELRLGLVPGGEIPLDSPLGYVFFMHRLKGLHPADAARKIAAHPNRRRLETDYFQAIYRQQKNRTKGQNHATAKSCQRKSL